MKTKLTIGIVMITDGWSGAERAIYEICKLLSKHQNIIFFTNNEVQNYYSDIKNVKVVNLGDFLAGGKINRIRNLYFVKDKILESIYREKIDVLNLYSPYSFMVLYIMYKKINIPLVSTLQGAEISNYYSNSLNPNYIFEKICTGKALEISDRIIAVAKHQRIRLPDKYLRKTFVIPNGVDTNIFKPLSKIKQEKNVILFAGRFIDMKGVRELLNISKQLPKYEFWFIGKGRLGSLIHGKNVHNLGFKTTEELVKLYNQATICVFPSHTEGQLLEGLPLCGLEAMACGRVVVATPLGFLEYIENGKDGVIIPAKDEKALLETIIRLMTDVTLRELLEKNVRKKAYKFNWESISKQYLKVFMQVINMS